MKFNTNIIALAVLPLLIFIPEGLILAADKDSWFNKCPFEKRPSKHEELKYAFCGPKALPSSDDFSDWPQLNKQVNVEEFNSDAVCLCYGVKTGLEGWAAINVIVIRYFRDVRDDLEVMTKLIRNEGFLKPKNFWSFWFWSSEWILAEKPPKSIETTIYEGFHGPTKKPGSNELSEKFHAYWDESSKAYSLEPDNKRSLFRFPSLHHTLRSSEIFRSSYLIRYISNSEGSWIPFWVGTGAIGNSGENLEGITIRISDLTKQGLQAKATFEMIETIE